MTNSGAAIPDPLDVWTAARDGRRVTVEVNPEHREGTVQFSGVVTERRKIGSGDGRSVTVHLIVDGEISGMEIEANMGRDEWGPFRAFHYTEGHTVERGVDSWYRYIGKVTALDISTTAPEPRDDAADTREVAP